MSINTQNPSMDSNFQQPQMFPFVPPGDSIVKNETNISTLVKLHWFFF